MNKVEKQLTWIMIAWFVLAILSMFFDKQRVVVYVGISVIIGAIRLIHIDLKHSK